MSNPPASAPPSASSRVKSSLRAWFGDIVFGMEDGTVSIFGLVFGVSANTTDSRRPLPTTLQTLDIAAAAGLAGVAVGALFS